MPGKKIRLTGRYREGAKGRCFECGLPEGEHKDGKCPDFRGRHSYKQAHGARGRYKTRGRVWFES